MTRSHKFGDKDHAGLADGTVAPQEHVPKFFAKNGFADADPKKTKKNGGGRGNWYATSLSSSYPPSHSYFPVLQPLTHYLCRGNAGEEVIDEPSFNFANARRRSNSSSISSQDHFKTKWEVNEPEPVFEESLHGAPPADDMEKVTTSSSSSASV